MENTFGILKTVSVHDSYKDHWVAVNQLSGTSNTGNLIGNKDGYLLLLPYQGLIYSDNGLEKKVIVDEGNPIAIHGSVVLSITPINRKSVENLCAAVNRNVYREEVRKSHEFEEFVKTIDSKVTSDENNSYEENADGLGI